MYYGPPPTGWNGGQWMQLWNSCLLSFLKLLGHDRFLWCFESSFVLSRYSIYQTLFCSWQFLFDDIKLPLGVQAHKWEYFFVVIMEKTDHRPKFHAIVHLCFYGSVCFTYCQQTVIEGPTKFLPEDLVTTWFYQL
jgi:hypothetical protein